MNVTAPGVDTIAFDVYLIFSSRLAKGEVRFAFPNAKFDENPRHKLAHQIVSKGQMHTPMIPKISLYSRPSVGWLNNFRKSRSSLAESLLAVFKHVFRACMQISVRLTRF